MIRRLKRLTNAGDTIVEVMIVLAVLGLALSIAYATANRGLQQSRNAQEHSQALGIINSQVELLRSAFAKKAGDAIEAMNMPTPKPFCLSPSGSAVSIKPLANGGPNSFQENLANDHLGTTPPYPAECIQDTFYNISIIGRGNGVYDFRVRWQGVGQLGRQQEELTYKIGNVIPLGGGGYTDPEAPPAPPAPTLTVNMTINNSTGTINITAGDTVNLVWSTSPAGASCTGAGHTPAGGFAGIIFPDHGNQTQTTTFADGGQTYTFTLNCTLAGASDSKTITVVVAPYSPILATLYRSWSSSLTDHFYSTNASEGPALPGTYIAQGNAGMVDTRRGPGEVPLYRLYNSSIFDHFYTTDSLQRAAAPLFGYRDEGVVGYIVPYNGSCPTGTQPLYVTYSAYLTDHFYTTNFQEYADERDKFGGSSGPYNQPEGVMGCVYDASIVH